MKHKKALFIVVSGILIGIFFYNVEAQNAAPSKPTMTVKEMEKKKKDREKKIKKATDSALRAHMRHQSPEVRKRMRKDLRKANQYNSQ
jgi:hypothetical protein